MVGKSKLRYGVCGSGGGGGKLPLEPMVALLTKVLKPSREITEQQVGDGLTI